MFKKGDGILLSLIAVTALVSFAVIKMFSAGGSTVTVKQDNKTVYEGSLYKDAEIKLKGNTAKIENGSALMLDADCKNQICVKHKKISKNGETIICLPNRVIIEVK